MIIEIEENFIDEKGEKNKMVKLQEYINEKNEMLELIKCFWLCHNGESQTDDEAMGD